MFPRPSCVSTGSSRPPTASATWPSVFAPTSPYSAASGSSPAPQASMTMTKARVPTAPGTLPGAGPRVGVEVDVLEPLGRQVGVDLGRGDVGVAEHLLQRAQVAAAGQQVRGERVAESVRAHLVVEARGARVALDDL